MLALTQLKSGGLHVPPGEGFDYPVLSGIVKQLHDVVKKLHQAERAMLITPDLHRAHQKPGLVVRVQ